MQVDRQARIRERAYQIWLVEGRVEGRQDEHWRRAEREIADEEARATVPADPGGRPTRGSRVPSARSAAAAVKEPRRQRSTAAKK